MVTTRWLPGPGHQDGDGVTRKIPGLGRQDVVNRKWLPGFGLQDVVIRKWQVHGCQDVAARMWPSGYGHQEVAARMWPSGCGHQEVAARMWPSGSGCQVSWYSVKTVVRSDFSMCTLLSITGFSLFVFRNEITVVHSGFRIYIRFSNYWYSIL